MLKIDILVIGSGLAGCIAALTAADQNNLVIIISKTDSLLGGNSTEAQGGIIYRGCDDTRELLAADIHTAGDGICWKPAVNTLVELGPRLVKQLLIDRFKVDFDRSRDGQLDLTSEAAHSRARIIHAKDKTGDAIQSHVLPEVENHPNIQVLTGHTAVDLLTLSHHSKNLLDIYKKPACFGALVLNNKEGSVRPIFAGETILATGGLGQLYKHTSNPPESTGDGIALAWRAGARCFNLQYIQFHPTTLYNEKDRFLISESVRGEGARLIDKSGQEFMKQYHELGDLAPRDIVARGIHQNMLLTGHPCVYLDISSKKSSWIKSRFPTIYERCLRSGYDMTSEPIPVVPASHYSCGGVGVNLKGRTSLQRLYAVGEVACTGVHGANRLASTSLLEAMVWGFLAGTDAAVHCGQDQYCPEIFTWKDGTEFADPALIAQEWDTIRNSMWNYVGLVRTRQRLIRARTIFRHLQSEIEHFYQKAKLTKEVLQLRNGIQTAIAVTSATLEAPISKGAHYIEQQD